MVRLSALAGLAFTTTILAIPAPIESDSSVDDSALLSCGGAADMAGSQNVGLGNGQQFITGQCLSAADCASGCCVDQGSGLAVCKARIVTEMAGGSCDFSCANGGGGGSANPLVITPIEDDVDKSNDAVTNTAEITAVDGGSCGAIADAAGSQNVGTGSASQFITGQCFSRSDCASDCCVAQDSGIALCKASLLTQQQGLSCDFTCSAGGGNAAADTEEEEAGAEEEVVEPTNNASEAPAAGGSCGAIADMAGSQNVGKGSAAQFITGQCLSRSDCASDCCVAQDSGIALCKASLLTRQQGLSCDFSCAA